MKVIFMGTPEFAVKSLEVLAEHHQVLAVVTQPDKPKGRGKKMLCPPVKERAMELGIECLQPINAKDGEFAEQLKKYQADIFVVAAYGQILTEDVLFMPKYGSVNVHGSLLPRYRGAGPIQWAIIDGCQKTGVTIMQMEKGLDSGDMIAKAEMEIREDDTYGTLGERMAAVGAQLLIQTIEAIEQGTAVKTPQNHDESTYAPMIHRETGHIDWHKSSWEISCLVRGLDPQPGAYCDYNGEILKIWQVLPQDDVYEGCTAGEIVGKNKKGFIVKTGDKSIFVLSVQAKGGKKMPADAYMRGHDIEIGIILR